jgi:hypothetical protein
MKYSWKIITKFWQLKIFMIEDFSCHILISWKKINYYIAASPRASHLKFRDKLLLYIQKYLTSPVTISFHFSAVSSYPNNCDLSELQIILSGYNPSYHQAHMKILVLPILTNQQPAPRSIDLSIQYQKLRWHFVSGFFHLTRSLVSSNIGPTFKTAILCRF